VTFSRSKGLYGGLCLDGALVAAREDLNRAYYGKALTPRDIFIRRTVPNLTAGTLLAAVSAIAEAR
jgi:SH3 domain-containing YSC84-like protein 1